MGGDGMGGQGRAGGRGRNGEGREGREREKGREGGKGREGKENGDRPPTIFGLKVALAEDDRVTTTQRSGRRLTTRVA